MALTSIESTGFNSLFMASARLSRQTIDANVPSQKEKNLRADNRSLIRENSSLSAENKSLTKENIELVRDNRQLSQKVNQFQTEQARNFKENETKIDTGSEKQDVSPRESQDITQKAPVKPAKITAQPIEVSQTISYNANSELSNPATAGNSFNSFV